MSEIEKGGDVGRPQITDQQRAVAVALLANAIRRDEHLRARAERLAPLGGPLAGTAGRGRRSPSHQYVRGMRDLLAVLFEGGRAVADECEAAARVEALGTRHKGAAEDGTQPATT